MAKLFQLTLVFSYFCSSLSAQLQSPDEFLPHSLGAQFTPHHLLVDYVEQVAANSPYYFAPAAKPFHPYITGWQRDFQMEIGKNNACYFDQNGWLYFTRERFDPFYPSYGDTYPTFNGSIGMTYEQGGIGAGRAVITENGDTLTLADRIAHHTTTTLATVETALPGVLGKREIAIQQRHFHGRAIAPFFYPVAQLLLSASDLKIVI